MPNNLIPIQKPLFFAAVTAKTTVKAGHWHLHGWTIVNQTGAEAFVQVFDKLLADVNLGTTVPDYVIPIPASSGAVEPFSPAGFEHTIGIVIACTTTPGGAAAAACDVLMYVR